MSKYFPASLKSFNTRCKDTWRRCNCRLSKSSF